MSKNKQQNAGLRDLERAQYEVEQAKKRFTATSGTLQYRLKPGTLAGNAWAEVRGKGSVVADDARHSVNGIADGAVQAVRERPLAASGIAAAVLIFLAREPLWRAVSGLFREDEDKGIVKTDLDNHEANYDLTAPTVERSTNEGVTA